MLAIPEHRHAAVSRALTTAFGVSEPEGLTRLSGGLSGAGVYRIRVGGIAYVLRLETPANAFGDVGRAYACQRIAMQAALSPAVRYACADDGVAILDYVEPRSLALDYPGDGRPLVVELAQAVRVLHRTPAFPPLVDYLEGMQALIDRHRASGLLDPAVTASVLERYAVLAAGYRTRDEDRVSSHNDLNPANIVYDGRRLWLIDWEAAFLADRYVDLATVANWFASDPAREDLLLRTYFNAEPTAEQRARLYLMRLVNHVFYGMVMLNGAADERPGARLPDRDLAGPSLEEIGRRLRLGEFDMTGWENRIAYAKARLRAAHDGMQGSAFEAAMARIAA